MQMIPLEHTILYSADSYPNRYWALQRNTTEWSVFMNEITTSGNEIVSLMLHDLASQLPGAHLGKYQKQFVVIKEIDRLCDFLQPCSTPMLYSRT